MSSELKKENVKIIRKRTGVSLLILVLIIIAIAVLGMFKPDQATMISQASPEMQALIAKDNANVEEASGEEQTGDETGEESGRKRPKRKYVTITYNDLIFINYCSFSSSGADERIERYVGFAGKVFYADEGAAKIVGQMINYTYRILGCGESIIHGAKLTILLAILTVIVGVILGTLLALGKISKRKWLSKLCSGYIFFFRGTPLLMQLLVIYFTVPGIFGFTWRGLFKGLEAVNQGAFVAAFITFSLNSGAYCAEIVRAAIQSIDKGQNEAAKALGMNYSQTMTKIIIPQAVRRMIPPVCNEFIMILKDVSIVFAIGLADITQISNSIVAANAGDYLVFVPAVIIYLIITAVFSKLFEYIEKKYSVYE